MSVITVVLKTNQNYSGDRNESWHKSTGLPDLTANLLRDGGCLIDNLFADLWKQMGIKAKLKRLGFHKRLGTSSHELVFVLLVWVCL